MAEKPTIEELEKILEEKDLPIEMLPNGEIRVRDLTQEFIVGEYALGEWSAGKYWIRNKEGEGSEVDRESVEKMFERLFKENF